MKHNIGNIIRALVALPLLVGCDAALDAPVETAVVTTTDVATTTAAPAQESHWTSETPANTPQPAQQPAANPTSDPTTPPADEQSQQDQNPTPTPPGSKPADNQDETPQAPATPEPPPAKASIFDGGSAPTPWTANGTSKMPKYGEDCRLTTDTIFEAATNGLSDDSLSLVVYSPNETTLDLEVVTAQGLALSATVDLTRGLPGRSYRDAEGWATFEYAPGTTAEVPVIDGTLCFAEKLSEVSGNVLAEFSLIVVVDGVYQSMGGNVLIPGSALSNVSDVVVNASQTVDIDLR